MSDSVDLQKEITEHQKLSNSERLKQAKKKRVQQLKRYVAYEKSLEKAVRKGTTAPRKPKRNLKFTENVVLLESAARNDLDEVRELLSNGVSPDVANDDGLTALHQCCIDDSEDMCRLLLEFNANVNACDSELWTPLHAAATCGHVHLCKLLVEKGGQLLAVNADGNMPYDICEDDVTLEFIEMSMAKQGITQDQIDNQRLLPEKNMLGDLIRFSSQGGSLDAKDAAGATPLHIAAANGYSQVADFLLRRHVRTDIKDNDGWAALHIAACWANLDVIELIVQYGGDINIKTNNGESIFDICEDGELKERLMEIKKQSENHRLIRKPSLVRRKSSVSTRSASVRRTSIREKNLLSWKEARLEAKMRGTLSPDVVDERVAEPDNATLVVDVALPPLVPPVSTDAQANSNSSITVTASTNKVTAYDVPDEAAATVVADAAPARRTSTRRAALAAGRYVSPAMSSAPAPVIDLPVSTVTTNTTKPRPPSELNRRTNAGTLPPAFAAVAAAPAISTQEVVLEVDRKSSKSNNNTTATPTGSPKLYRFHGPTDDVVSNNHHGNKSSMKCCVIS